MKLSLNWISEHVDLSGIAPADVASILTRSTCEVEGIEEQFAFLDGVVAAHIVKREQHPNADRLSLCTVEADGSTLTVVCGAPNAAPGLVVPLARVGAKLPGADGFFEIKAARIRGVDSSGMLCAARELGLAEFLGESDGLLVLGRVTSVGGGKGSPVIEASPGLGSVRLGAPLSELLPLRDFVLEIDNKSITHRPDLWCHYGFSRELAMLLGRKLKPDPLGSGLKASAKTTTQAKKSSRVKKPKAGAAEPGKTIRIEKGAARAYFGAACSGVRVATSPLWMRARLFSVGQRPINNLVDASNYLMLESGQPNHVFDARRLTADIVSVKRTTEPCEFTTLDGIKRQLPAGTVLIEDGAGASARPVALAGIMGGVDSAVAADTTAVFLESATFHREDIRRTLSLTALRTDSAVRFEKGQDPAKAEPAIERLAELLSLTCPDLRLGSLVGAMPEGPVRSPIPVTVDFINARLGLTLKASEIRSTLQKLGFSVEASKGKDAGLKVTAPTHRSQYDILLPEDIVEEVGRVYGYDNIQARAPLFASRPVPANRLRMLERRVKRFLADAGGYLETNNYSFARVEDNERFGLGGIRLKNPSFHDRDRLRVSLLPGLLRQVAGNQDRYPDVRLFEYGRAYLPDPGPGTPVTELRRLVVVHLPDPEDPLAAGHTPFAQADTHIFRRFLELRNLFTELLSGVVGPVTAAPLAGGARADSLPVGEHLHPGCRIEWRAPDGSRLAVCGVLHPAWQSHFDLKRPAVTAELDLDRLLLAAEAGETAYRAPSLFPESYFELSLLLDEHRSTADPVTVLTELEETRIQQVRLLGIYQGEQLPADMKSASYRISCGRADGTLSGDEVQQLREQAIGALAKAGMPLR